MLADVEPVYQVMWRPRTRTSLLWGLSTTPGKGNCHHSSWALLGGLRFFQGWGGKCAGLAASLHSDRTPGEMDKSKTSRKNSSRYWVQAFARLTYALFIHKPHPACLHSYNQGIWVCLPHLSFQYKNWLSIIITYWEIQVLVGTKPRTATEEQSKSLEAQRTPINSSFY